METTKEERVVWLRQVRMPQAKRVVALCRDVDTVLAALEAEHALKPPHVPTVGCHICAVLE